MGRGLRKELVLNIYHAYNGTEWINEVALNNCPSCIRILWHLKQLCYFFYNGVGGFSFCTGWLVFTRYYYEWVSMYNKCKEGWIWIDWFKRWNWVCISFSTRIWCFSMALWRTEDRRWNCWSSLSFFWWWKHETINWCCIEQSCEDF